MRTSVTQRQISDTRKQRTRYCCCTMEKVISCWLVLFLALPSTCAIRRLNSINDLKEIGIGQSVPKHSLLLLHWFASAIDIDANNVISLTFDPNRDDYGSHHYGNYDNLLPESAHPYYTIGNINEDTSGSRHLPDYVVNPRAECNGRNRDRIIIQATQQRWVQNGFQIHRVYITQHFGNTPDTEYDSGHTYEITPNLLRQVRQFSTASGQQSLWNLRDRYGRHIEESQIRITMNTWGDLAGLGLLLLLTVIQNTSMLQSKQSATYTPTDKYGTYTSTSSYGNYSANRQNNWDNRDGDWMVTCFTIFLVVIIVFGFLAFMLNSVQYK